MHDCTKCKHFIGCSLFKQALAKSDGGCDAYEPMKCKYCGKPVPKRYYYVRICATCYGKLTRIRKLKEELNKLVERCK